MTNTTDTIDTIEVWQLRDALNTLPDDTKLYVNRVGNLSIIQNKKYIGVINLDWMEIEFYDDRGYNIKFGKQYGKTETVYNKEK